MISMITNCEMQLDGRNPHLTKLHRISELSTFDRRVKSSSIDTMEILTSWWSNVYRSDTAFCYNIFSWWPGLVHECFILNSNNFYHARGIITTRDSQGIMFSPCVFVCVCLSVYVWNDVFSGWFNYEGLVPHKEYFAGALLGMSSCASYVSRTHDVIDEVTK